MKASFIKTTEKGATFAQVFGEEFLNSIVEKFKNSLGETKNFKEIVDNIDRNMSKEEVAVMSMLAVSGVGAMKGIMLTALSNQKEEKEFNLDINPKEEKLIDALGKDNAIISVRKFMEVSQGESSDTLGVATKELLDNMSKEELIVALLLVA